MPANSSLASIPPKKRPVIGKLMSGPSQFHGFPNPSIPFLSAAQWITNKLNLKNLAGHTGELITVTAMPSFALSGQRNGLIEHNIPG